MKKYIFLIVIAAFVSALFYSREEKVKVPARLVLRAGSECDYVPNSWEDNKPSAFSVPITSHEGYYADGYDIQIAKIVARELNVELDVRKIAWNDLIPALQNGEIDAIFSSMLDTEERRKVIAFSDPYEVKKAEYGVIVESVSPYITAVSLRDFSGARIIGQKGTNLDTVISQIPGVVHLKPAEKIQGMIDLILNGEADGAVIDTDTGHYYETMNKGLTMINFSGDEGFKLGFSGVCAGVRKGDTELLHKINIALGNIARNERQNIMDAVTSRMMITVH